MDKAKNDIIAVWQPVGVSTNRLSQIMGEHYNVLSSHTGTLDPMAEGVVIILLGENRYKKYEYAHWLKEYEFEIVFGLQTDSFDGMGFITAEDDSFPSEEEITNTLPSLIGKYTQKVPMFSAVKVAGKKMFDWAHNKTAPPEIPEKKGKIVELELVSYEKLEKSDAAKTVLKKLKNIRGNFRQGPIIEQWEKITGKERMLIKAGFRVKMTKGLYVRSLSQDICKKLGCWGFVYSLVRTRNGIYGKPECKTVEDLFGSSDNFNDFVSGIKTRN